MRNGSVFVIAAAACSLWCGCAITREAAQEAVLDFQARIRVQQDGSLQVRETIAVRTTGDRDRCGMWREFPLELTDSAGNRRPFEFEIEEARIDGQATDHSLLSIPGATRLYMGDRQKPLEPGRHEFSITYRSSPVVEKAKGREALVWPLLGYGWTLPIRSLEAVFLLPTGRPEEIEATVTADPALTGGQSADVKTERRRVEVAAGPLEQGTRLQVRISWPSARPGSG